MTKVATSGERVKLCWFFGKRHRPRLDAAFIDVYSES